MRALIQRRFGQAPGRVGLFMVGLAVLFGAALGIGHIAGGKEKGRAPEAMRTHGGAMAAGAAISDAGYTLQPDNTRLHDHGDPVFRFRIVGPEGGVVKQFTPVNDWDMHLVVVGRDGEGYRHLQPIREGDGAWSTPLRLPAAGSYRALTIFEPTATHQVITLGVDLSAGGRFQPQAPPPLSRVVKADDLDVTVNGSLNPGHQSRLTFSVTGGGKPVSTLQPYLDAYGYLTVLRGSDLFYVPAKAEPGGSGPDLNFTVTTPGAGDYRLFLDFSYEGSVRTAAFTMNSGSS